jgi:nitroimidazol reductase NimA-like FMN-containing flavoprotein (pyridoxamine 5'-phosphate oxidase superfamily)
MPAPNRSRPLFRRLNEKSSRALLERNHVGRLCFINSGQPDVTPVHYIADGAWIFIRSAPGAKIEAFAHHPYVAFEVDEIASTFDWRSVVARGTIYLLPSDGSPLERKKLDRAIRALRSFIPATFTETDPTPARDIVYGIHVDELTGRKATPHVATSERTTRRAIRRPSRIERGGKGT